MGSDTDGDWVEDPTATDYARAARQFLAARNYQHAVIQVAAALSLQPQDEELLALCDRILAEARSPLLLTPEGGDCFFGLLAVRARTLARLGRIAEALDRLFDAVLFRPSVSYLPWAEAWIRSDKGARAVDPESLAARCLELERAAATAGLDDDTRRNLAAAQRIAARVGEVKPTPSLAASCERLGAVLGGNSH